MGHRRTRPAAVLICAGVLACSPPQAPEDLQAVALPRPGAAPSDAALAVIDLTSAERTKAGVTPLAAELRLIQAAQIHADQMARLGRLDHVLPNATYPRPEDRLTAVSYRWEAFAENVAFGQRTPAEAVNGWMQSSGHRANILNPAYTEMGAGYARDSSGRPYWVQVFGKPLP